MKNDWTILSISLLFSMIVRVLAFLLKTWNDKCIYWFFPALFGHLLIFPAFFWHRSLFLKKDVLHLWKCDNSLVKLIVIVFRCFKVIYNWCNFNFSSSNKRRIWEKVGYLFWLYNANLSHHNLRKPFPT